MLGGQRTTLWRSVSPRFPDWICGIRLGRRSLYTQSHFVGPSHTISAHTYNTQGHNVIEKSRLSRTSKLIIVLFEELSV